MECLVCDSEKVVVLQLTRMIFCETCKQSVPLFTYRAIRGREQEEKAREENDPYQGELLSVM